MKPLTIIEFAVSAVLLAAGFAGFAATRKGSEKCNKKKHRLFTVLMVASGWFLIGTAITAVFSVKREMSVEFNLLSERVSIFGISFAQTTVVSWGIILLVLILALIFRFICLPRFNPDKPTGLQNVIELAVESMDRFAKNTLLDYSGKLAPYMFTLAVYMVFCAMSELFGLRPPTSDIVVTFSMGILTFGLINVCGIKKKGMGGRLKKLTQPTPVILPMKILSDIAVPVSLACRLFGNMLGGMIVMDLLKSVLGGYAIGLPPVAGLYFNLFHPLIQTYIFMILSMTFINEAME